jgi:hypothetical protein
MVHQSSSAGLRAGTSCTGQTQPVNLKKQKREREAERDTEAGFGKIYYYYFIQKKMKKKDIPNINTKIKILSLHVLPVPSVHVTYVLCIV